VNEARLIMSHQSWSSQRRTFLKTAAAGAVLGSTTLAFAENCSDNQASSGRSGQLPDTIRGEVLRTDGTLSLDQPTFVESQREIPVAGKRRSVV